MVRRFDAPERVPHLWTAWAASRPKQLGLILLVYSLGVGIATTGPPLVHSPVASTLADVRSGRFASRTAIGAVPLLAVATTVHYANEYADVETDARTDRTPFSGGSGALATTGLPASFLGRATALAFAVSTAAITAALVTAWLPLDAAALLAAILTLGLAYSLPPVALVRQGVGEAVNAGLGGLLLPGYGAAVVAAPAWDALLAVVPFALVVQCNLFATHWPDRNADAAVGKRTLAVRWTPGRIRRAYLTLAVAATILSLSLWLARVFPDVVLIAHLTPLPFLAWGWTTLTRQASPFPSVLAMVVLAVASTVAWWYAGLGG